MNDSDLVFVAEKVLDERRAYPAEEIQDLREALEYFRRCLKGSDDAVTHQLRRRARSSLLGKLEDDAVSVIIALSKLR